MLGLELIIAAFTLWVLPIWVGHEIGKPKQRSGGLWGFFLGWVGVVVVALLPSKADIPAAGGVSVVARSGPMYRECPHCKEQMRRDASVCPHCHNDSSAWTLKDGFWWHQSQAGPWYMLDEKEYKWIMCPGESLEAASLSREALHATDAARRSQPALLRECPQCKEQMPRDSSVCPHCSGESPAWTLKDGLWWHRSGAGDWYMLDKTTNEWIKWQEESTARDGA